MLKGQLKIWFFIAVILIIMVRVTACCNDYDAIMPGSLAFIYGEHFSPPFFPGAETQSVLSVGYYYFINFNGNGWSNSEVDELLKGRPDVFRNDLGYFENLTSGSSYSGFADGYIYRLGTSYCRTEDYPLADKSGFVKVVGNDGDYLWYLHGGRFYRLDLSSGEVLPLAVDNTGGLLAEGLNNFYVKDGNLYATRVDFADGEEFEDYFYDKLHWLEENPQDFFPPDMPDLMDFALMVMTREDIVYKWLSMMVENGYYPSKLTESGLWGRKLELYAVGDTGMTLEWKYLDRSVSFMNDKWTTLGYRDNILMTMNMVGELTGNVRLTNVDGRFIVANRFLSGDGNNFVNYFNWLKVGEDCRERGVFYDMDVLTFKGTVLEKGVSNKCFKSGYNCEGSFPHEKKHYFYNCVGWDRRIKVPDFSFYKEESDLIDMAFESESNQLVGVYSFFSEGKSEVKSFSLTYPDCSSVTSSKWEVGMLYDRAIYSVESSDSVSNLKPFFVGNYIYFQCELSSATNLVEGLCRYDLDSEKVTHLRSDIPPANTVDFPPEEDWDDKKLYVTGDGRYALLVPIHFTKKCLTDNPEDCIYCNRDISPNVWDFGSFNKIYAYNLTDTTQPPVEIDVTGYDGYLVPSPDHMQFTFSMGDRIGILDGKTLQVRVVEVR